MMPAIPQAANEASRSLTNVSSIVWVLSLDKPAHAARVSRLMIWVFSSGIGSMAPNYSHLWRRSSPT